MEDKDSPPEPNSVLGVEGLNFPVHIAEGVLIESSNVLKHSVSLGSVSWLSSLVHKLAEVTI